MNVLQQVHANTCYLLALTLESDIAIMNGKHITLLEHF